MYLLYCIMKTPLASLKPAVAGLGGSPVFLTSCNGLSAALSKLPPSPGLPGTKELLDYSRVIEELHLRHGVIPIRYGCCFEEPLHIHDLLRQRTRQYLTLLDELAGNVEMGIRILFPADQDHSGGNSSCVTATQGDGKGATDGLVSGKGHDFLATRKTHYIQVDQASRRYTQAATYYGEVFSASCLRHIFEADEEKSLLSLYFLIPERQVERFRETFHSIKRGVGERILMSGPWPPYNFAVEAQRNIGTKFEKNTSAPFVHLPLSTYKGVGT